MTNTSSFPQGELRPYVPAVPAAPAPAQIQDTVEVTVPSHEPFRGVVVARFPAEDGTITGYRVWVPGANHHRNVSASDVTPLRDTRPAGTRRRSQNELNQL